MTVGIVVAAVTSMVLTNKAATQVLMVRKSWAVMVLIPGCGCDPGVDR